MQQKWYVNGRYRGAKRFRFSNSGFCPFYNLLFFFHSYLYSFSSFSIYFNFTSCQHLLRFRVALHVVICDMIRLFQICKICNELMDVVSVLTSCDSLRRAVQRTPQQLVMHGLNGRMVLRQERGRKVGVIEVIAVHGSWVAIFWILFCFMFLLLINLDTRDALATMRLNLKIVMRLPGQGFGRCCRLFTSLRSFVRRRIPGVFVVGQWKQIL